MPLTPTTVSPLPAPIFAMPDGNATYRAAFNVAAVVGQAIEVVGSASRTIFITEIEFQSSASVTLILTVQSVASTAGTSTNATAVPLDSNNVAATATVKEYTAAPTAGTAVGDIARITGVTRETFNFEKDANAQNLVLRGITQSLALDISGGATITGFIEWREV